MQLKVKTYGLCRKRSSNFQTNTVARSFSRPIVRLNTTLEPILLVFIMIYSCYSEKHTIFKSCLLVAWLRKSICGINWWWCDARAMGRGEERRFFLMIPTTRKAEQIKRILGINIAKMVRFGSFHFILMRWFWEISLEPPTNHYLLFREIPMHMHVLAKNPSLNWGSVFISLAKASIFIKMTHFPLFSDMINICPFSDEYSVKILGRLKPFANLWKAIEKRPNICIQVQNDNN